MFSGVLTLGQSLAMWGIIHRNTELIIERYDLYADFIDYFKPFRVQWRCVRHSARSFVALLKNYERHDGIKARLTQLCPHILPSSPTGNTMYVFPAVVSSVSCREPVVERPFSSGTQCSETPVSHSSTCLRLSLSTLCLLFIKITPPARSDS